MGGRIGGEGLLLIARGSVRIPTKFRTLPIPQAR
jgi:hypothetical protein